MPPLSQCWAKELTLPLTSYNTQESGPCTSPGHHIRADTVGRGAGKQPHPSQHEHWENWLQSSSVIWWVGKRYPSSTTRGRQMSWLQDQKNGRAVFTMNQLKYLGEWTMYITWTTQWSWP